MLTDIIQTITYTLDTKVLSPYNACIDWYRLFKDDVDFQRFKKGFEH